MRRSTSCFLTPSFGAVLAIGVWAGCATTPADATGDDQNITATDCDVVDVQTGKKMTADELKNLNDPVAQLVIGGAICPKSFKEITAKLAKTDAKDCEGAGGGSAADGGIAPDEGSGVGPSGEGGGAIPGDTSENVSTRFVSESSQLVGKPETYRAVYKRQCSGRSDHELLVSAFGIHASAPALPTNVELIGEDKTTGVYNFYAREDDQWKFFGSSKDFVSAGYTCQGGACESNLAAKARCAGCHSGGGLVMKELESPWVHWEGETNTPGTDDLMARLPELGTKGSGADLEGSVEQGNEEWIPKRVNALKELGAAEVLRPLFCTVDVNLQSMATGSKLSAIQNNLFLDPFWAAADSIAVNDADYQALKKANGQAMLDDDGNPVSNTKGPADDTFFAFTYPARVSTSQDEVYISALFTFNVIDLDFAKDVLAIDFTRPIFSQTRCDLLSAAPDLKGSAITPQAVKDGFAKNLAGKTGAAAELAASLGRPDDADDHLKATTTFLAACKARPQKDFLADAMTYASHLRSRFRKLQIAEFAETMCFDKVADTNEAFDPVTCTLK